MFDMKNLERPVVLHRDDDNRTIVVSRRKVNEIKGIQEDFWSKAQNSPSTFDSLMAVKLAWFKIESYKVFNNKVVVVNFEDGTTEKAICDDEDSFSVETGLGICLLKHILGGSGAYNRLIQKTVKRHNKELEAEEKVKKETEAKKLAEEKKKAKRAKKRKEKQVEMYKEALVRAKKEVEA